VDQQRPAGDIEQLLAAETAGLLTDWSIADIFSGAPLENNQKSVTIHLIYRSSERTLEDQEATQDTDRLASLFRTKLGAIIS
jgi:phenylalanyl-tRNA synthetase beta subunit